MVCMGVILGALIKNHKLLRKKSQQTGKEQLTRKERLASPDVTLCHQYMEAPEHWDCYMYLSLEPT
jgi:hypothetical protein